MGKYMRKSKAAAAEDAVMDMPTTTKPPSSPTLGVRTRAKTLALRKLQLSYLQLRSRKLQRLSVDNPSPSPKTRASSSSRLLGVSSNLKAGEDENQQIGNRQGHANFGACIGENFAGGERSMRESTPCSFMKDLDTVGTPGSNTSASSPTEVSRKIQNSPSKFEPKASEVEEFFAGAEQEQHKQFIAKYNFDPVKEKPLPGRYRWVKTKNA